MADPKPQLSHPEKFINIAFWFEASLIGVAWLTGWFAEINPIANLYFSTEALIDGIMATIPMFILFLLFYQYPVGPLYPIRKNLLDIMGPLLSSCRWYELLSLAAVAGISEEILFRGVLQPWMEAGLGVSVGLILSNVIFGLLHWITATYALIAVFVSFDTVGRGRGEQQDYNKGFGKTGDGLRNPPDNLAHDRIIAGYL